MISLLFLSTGNAAQASDEKSGSIGRTTQFGFEFLHLVCETILALCSIGGPEPRQQSAVSVRHASPPKGSADL
jgi:hypothetical protein